MSRSKKVWLAGVILAVFAVFLPGCSDGEPDQAQPQEPEPARNVILLVGDGMGISSLTAARIWRYGPDGRLAMDGMSVRGLIHTHSASRIVTDSAASATAWATGHKTTNGLLSLDPDRNVLETILEQAKANGKATGLVSTCRITHATPAAMNAHSRRDAEEEIAVEMLDGDVDVLLGGGLSRFIAADRGSCKTARKDGLDLVEQAEAMGYAFVDDRLELLATEAGMVLGLFHCDHMSFDLNRDGAVEPSLAEMTAKGIELLARDPDGFFLQVEGGRIDHAGHYNHGLNNMGDTIAFDEAVREALRFAQSPSGLWTLVIVIADHETGGLAIAWDSAGGKVYHADKTGPAGNGRFPVPDHPGELVLIWASSHHTGQDILVMAEGPRSEALSGVIDNTDLYDIMYEAMALR